MEEKYTEFKVKINDLKKVNLEIIKDVDHHVSFPATMPQDYLSSQTNDVFNKMLINKRLNCKEDFIVLGSHLYRTLFNAKIDECDETIDKKFINEYETSKKEGNKLRLVLEFDLQNASKLAEWPWEYLYYPDAPKTRGAGFFIAQEAQLVLARRVPQDTWDFQKLNSPLCILFVVGPTPSTDKYSEIISKPVEGAFQKLEESYPGKIKFQTLKEPTKEEFREKVKIWKPQVVHYLGHGKVDAVDKKGYLSWKTPPEDGLWIDEDTFAESFAKHQPRLIFLQACDSATSYEYSAFKGVAYRLIYQQRSIPAVIAMQHPIGQEVGIIFAQTFYRSLGEGKRIGVAVQEARDAAAKAPTKDYSERGFGGPILFLQAEGSIIEQMFEPEKPQPQKCPYSFSPAFGCNGEIIKRNIKKGDICDTCRRPIMECPDCHAVMGTRIGVCACGFILTKSREEKEENPDKDDFKNVSTGQKPLSLTPLMSEKK